MQPRSLEDGVMNFHPSLRYIKVWPMIWTRPYLTRKAEKLRKSHQFRELNAHKIYCSIKVKNNPSMFHDEDVFIPL